MTVLAILGGARENGDTQAVLNTVLAGRSATVLDLRLLNIQHYEYGGDPARDDLMQVVTAMLAHERIVFVTPVYWYAMSGRMKVLFDRLTDVVTMRKDVGRALAGRVAFLVACGTEGLLPDGFEVPFRDTARYLGMSYGGSLYAPTSQTESAAEVLPTQASRFGDQLFA